MKKLLIISIIVTFLVPWFSGCSKESTFVPWKASHWEKVEEPLDSEKIKEGSLCVHGDFWNSPGLITNPLNPNLVLLQLSSFYIQRSENGGKTWDNVLSPIQQGPTIVSKDARVIYYIDSFCGGLIHLAFPCYSLDFGKTWKRSPLPPLPVRPDMPYSHDSVIADPDDPNILYVISTSGIFKSVEGKGAYEYYPIFDTVNTPYIYVDPKEPNCIYVALLNYRTTNPLLGPPNISSSITFKSVDCGKRWEKMGSFYFNPLSPEIRLKADFDIDPAHFTNTFRASLDNGKNFVPSDLDLNKNWLYSISVGRHGLVYADTALGLFKSTDNGVHFFKVVDPDGASWDLLEGNACLNSKIFINLADPNVVYWASQCERSTDAGKTWSTMDVVKDKHVNGSVITVDPNNSNIVYLGVIDVPWEEPAPSKPINKPSSQTTPLIPPDDQGIYKSIDGGKSWKKVGLDGDIISAITVSPTTGIIYAGTYYDGLFKSVDSGKTWERIPLDNDLHLSVSSLAVDAKNGIAYIGVLGGGVFRTEDKS